jgi:hypothetical protein
MSYMAACSRLVIRAIYSVFVAIVVNMRQRHIADFAFGCTINHLDGTIALMWCGAKVVSIGIVRHKLRSLH